MSACRVCELVDRRETLVGWVWAERVALVANGGTRFSLQAGLSPECLCEPRHASPEGQMRSCYSQIHPSSTLCSPRTEPIMTFSNHPVHSAGPRLTFPCSITNLHHDHPSLPPPPLKSSPQKPLTLIPHFALRHKSDCRLSSLHDLHGQVLANKPPKGRLRSVISASCLVLTSTTPPPRIPPLPLCRLPP